MRLFIALFAFSTLAHGAPFTEIIDLNEPAALDALKARHPEHVQRVEKILAIAKERPKPELGPWIETTFDAQDVDIARLWQVSDPPKLKVAFTLDRTRYTASVVANLEPAKFIPAR